MTIQFRQAQYADLANIIATYNSTIASKLVTADIEPISIESRRDWFDSHTPNHRPLWIVLVNSQYAGWMSFSSFYGRPAYDGTVEISLYLEEAYRYKGLGKVCLQKAFESCEQLHISTLLGFIFDHNEPSLQLFYSMGFEKWGHLPKIANMQDTERGLVIVGKRIDKS